MPQGQGGAILPFHMMDIFIFLGIEAIYGSFIIIRGKNTVDSNDLFRFSIRQEKWEKVNNSKISHLTSKMNCQGEIPQERRRQTIEVCGNQTILFGGFNGAYLNCMHYLNLLVTN